MPYCVAVGGQKASVGKCPVLGLSWDTFPLHNKPMLDQWLHNIARKKFARQKDRICVQHVSLKTVLS